MSSFASEKKRRRKSNLKKTKKEPDEEGHMVEHSITISDSFLGEKETLRDEPGARTMYSGKKRKAHTKHARFHQFAAIRQHSAHGEDGNAIEGSAVHSKKEHCPIGRKDFFVNLVPKAQNYEEISPETIEETINKNKDGSISTIDAALWLITYIEKKKSIVVKDPTKKASLGEYNISFKYLYILGRIITAINEFINKSSGGPGTDDDDFGFGFDVDVEEPLPSCSNTPTPKKKRKTQGSGGEDGGGGVGEDGGGGVGEDESGGGKGVVCPDMVLAVPLFKQWTV